MDVGGLRFSPEARTALAFVSLRNDGERSFMFYRHPSADMLWRPEDVDREYVAGTRIFHHGSISLINEPSRSATLAAVEYARKGGALISYDPNLRLALWPSPDAARAGILAAWPSADLIKVSEEELEFLTGDLNIERAAAISLVGATAAVGGHAWGGRVHVLHAGGQRCGARLCGASSRYHGRRGWFRRRDAGRAPGRWAVAGCRRPGARCCASETSWARWPLPRRAPSRRCPLARWSRLFCWRQRTGRNGSRVLA